MVKDLAGHRRGAAIALLAGDTALAIALFAPAWAHPTSVTVGAGQDTPYTVWAFAWVARAVAHAQSPWVTTHLSWPGGVNLLTNATATGLGLALTPVTWAWGPLVAFDVAATAALALTAWSAQVVMHRAGLASWPASAVGGLVAGFGPTALAQGAGAHLHVTAAFLVTPMLLGVGRLATGTARHPGRWGIALGALAAAQVLVGEEVLAITGITGLAGTAAWAAGVKLGRRGLARHGGDGGGPAPGRLARRAMAQAAPLAGVVFAALAAWPLWVQFTGRAHISGPIQHGDGYPNDAMAFVLPVRQVWLGAGWAARLTQRFPVPPSSEGGSYLGVPLLVVAVVTVVAHRRKLMVRVVGLTAAIVAALSLGSRLVVAGHRTSIPLPWAAIAHVPLLESLLPVRFGVVIDLLAGGLLAVALDGAARWGTRGGRLRWAAGRRAAGRRAAGRRAAVRWVTGAAPVALAVVCLAPLVPRLPPRTTRWAIPSFFTGTPSGVADGSLVALAPYPGEAHPEVEMWLAVAGDRWRSAGGTYFVPTPSGTVTIGGPVPASGAVEVRLERGESAASLEPLRAPVLMQLLTDQVGAVVVGPVPHRDQVLTWWSGLLGRPRQVGGVAVWILRPSPPVPRSGLRGWSRVIPGVAASSGRATS